MSTTTGNYTAHFTAAEDEHLWKAATTGRATLGQIGEELGRSRDACARRMQKLRKLNADRKANLAKQAAQNLSKGSAAAAAVAPVAEEEPQVDGVGTLPRLLREQYSADEDALVLMALYQETGLDKLPLKRSAKSVLRRALVLAARMREHAVNLARQQKAGSVEPSQN
jgi:DNA-binding Lrp family transcriptional regulator